MEFSKDEVWYRLTDLKEPLGHTETTANFRVRISNRYPQCCRHHTLRTNQRGRPSVETFIDQQGMLLVLGGKVEEVNYPQPALPPKRLSDKARTLISGPGEMSTHGIEETPRRLSREQFISEFQNDPRAAEFFENDFDPL